MKNSINMNKKTNTSHYLAILVAVVFSSQVCAMQELTEDEMKQSTGQALLNLSYLAPGATDNLQADTGFYKLGLDAVLQLNLNVKQIQLGCGGANDAIRPGCDIDIENLSLSGAAPGLDANGSPDFGSTPRPQTDAKLTNPFFNFAIKSPNSLVNRQLIGLQIGAEQLSGLLSAGYQDADGNQVLPGINRFSGYLRINPTTGVAETKPTRIIQNAGYSAINSNLVPIVTNRAITAKAKGLLIEIPIESTDYDLELTSAVANLTINATDVVGTRLTEAVVTGDGQVQPITLQGNLKSKAAGIIDLEKKIKGSLTNLTADVEATEPLSFIHNINLDNNPLSLSLQQESVIWPNAPTDLQGNKVAAQRGWWMAIGGGLDIGELRPRDQITISNVAIEETLAQTSQYLTANPIECGFILTSCLFGDTLSADVDLTGKPPVPFPTSDLILKNQQVVPNCYGGLTFC